MYPRTTHSTGSGSVLSTIIDRPSSWSRWRCSSGPYSAVSAVITWFGTRSARRRNQKSESWVSTTPLAGMPLGRTTSKALMRSVATISSRSPRSYTSRTLPRRHRRRPGIRVSSSGREASVRFSEAAFVMEEELPVPAGSSEGRESTGSPSGDAREIFFSGILRRRRRRRLHPHVAVPRLEVDGAAASADLALREARGRRREHEARHVDLHLARLRGGVEDEAAAGGDFEPHRALRRARPHGVGERPRRREADAAALDLHPHLAAEAVDHHVRARRADLRALLQRARLHAAVRDLDLDRPAHARQHHVAEAGLGDHSAHHVGGIDGAMRHGDANVASGLLDLRIAEGAFDRRRARHVAGGHGPVLRPDLEVAAHTLDADLAERRP